MSVNSEHGIFQVVNTGMLYGIRFYLEKLGGKFLWFIIFHLLLSLSTVLIDAPELVMTLGILGGRSILIKESYHRIALQQSEVKIKQSAECRGVETAIKKYFSKDECNL